MYIITQNLNKNLYEIYLEKLQNFLADKKNANILLSNSYCDFDEEKSNVYRIGVSSLVFALCHLSVFLSTFNPGDLIVVAYTLPLGILLGLTLMLSKSIIPAIVIHFLFNSFNQVIFSMFSYSALDNKAIFIYIVVNVVVSLVIASYLAIVLIIKRKQQHN